MDYPLLNIFFTTMWIFLWIMWFFLLFRVFGDLFRDDALSGWAKAGWSVFVLVLPFLGVFVYLIARGKGMGKREYQEAAEAEQEFRTYIRDAAGTTAAPTDHVAELARLAELKNHGDITEDEYQRAKELVLT
ncbi:phospholipase D-like protein [Streptomyces sp. 1114.5]|uniref:SHOCT domain-containing protein n=1 Tax=unclassified Streptomyces TaxID=2593676 RepID=UPI000BD2EC65|nr:MULTISPECIES: SHOCT domain-containing protein [unclassified Streptomyces]RKT19502.1 phospholipase D-like protein [Streptomyces sp. 1114.5]SOB85698.1 Phospholipase_D-nuclease N-terminal [Streptomyces sp. 1331.2]